jgi:TRAP transporter TAXI family solute receptor
MSAILMGAMTFPQNTQSASMDKFIAVGTGSISGVFYPVGKGICKLVNHGRLDHRVRCLAYETGGSVYNIEAVRSRELDVGITRSDLAALTYQGKTIPPNELGPATDLRALANLYEMPVGIIVKEKANIKTLKDFTGKRFNFGNRGSGKRTMAELLFKYNGWGPADFKRLTELSTKEMGEEFCNDKLDILLEILGHPASFYNKMIEQCGGKLYSFSKEEIEGLTKMLPFSAPQKIPGGLYYDTPNAISTFGYKAVMIASSKVHPKTIFHMMSSAFGNLKKLHKIHPALSATKRAGMAKGLVIPLHEGAKQFYGKKKIQKK